VLKRILAEELANRGVDDAEMICKRALGKLSSLRTETIDAASPEAVLRRLGGD
jgi:hypothetical protein